MTAKNTTGKIPPTPQADESATTAAATSERRKRTRFASDVESNISAIRAVVGALIYCYDVTDHENPATDHNTTPDIGPAALRTATLALEAVQLSAIEAGEEDWDPEATPARWRLLLER